MEILDLLTLIFCVLAVVLNAAAFFVLLKRKSGKGTPAYSLIFASFSFIFIIIGCIGYLFSAYPIVMLATLVLSGLCMLIYFATEKAPAQPAVAPSSAESFDFSSSSLLDNDIDAAPDLQMPAADYDGALDGVFDSLLPEPSSFLNDDLSDDVLTPEFSADDLGFSAEDLDDFDLDFGDDEDFDVVFPAEDEVLDEEFEAEFPQEDEPSPSALEEEPALEAPAFEGTEGSAEGASFDSDFTANEDEDAILNACQEFIVQSSEAMADGFDFDKLLDFANRSLIENTGADGGIILLVDDYDDVLNARAFSGQFPPPYKLPDDLPHTQKAVQVALQHAQLPFEGNVFGEAALSGEALHIEDGATDSRVYENGPEDFLKAGSYIIAPLSVKGRVVGVAGLARLPQREPFSEKDFKAAKALAGYGAAVISNAYSFQEIMERAELESGVEAATKIQRTFLPKRLPDLPEAGFGFFFQGAKGICTDYCDVIFARRDRIALVMADVAGKGIISGIIMAGLRALLHLVTNTTKSASTILGWVNKSITDKNIDIDHYAAVAYVSYSLETNKLEYASAGHQPMLLWHSAEKRIEVVNIESEPLGVDRNTEYKEKNLTVAAGDIIILFTDGLVETLNPQGVQYGVDGLSKVIAENEGASAKDIAAAVRHDLNDFMGAVALHDDQTLLVMKIQN